MKLTQLNIIAFAIILLGLFYIFSPKYLVHHSPSKELKGELEILKQSVLTFYKLNHRLPYNLEESVTAIPSKGYSTEMFKKLLTDPWGEKYIYIEKKKTISIRSVKHATKGDHYELSFTKDELKN
ncbi:MAG: hypothetical protein HRT88_20470 [Lentisphaeraceae bacterium]|nr:hypothetical protein [Lentisphaeraceae bacterium]